MPVVRPDTKYCITPSCSLDRTLTIWLYAMDGARDRLYEHGEVTIDQHLADRILNGLQGEYGYVRNCSYNQRDFGHCSYNQRDFGLDDVEWKLRNIYADNLARTSSRGKPVVGRGVAMHAQGESSGVRCFTCSEYGQYSNKCP